MAELGGEFDARRVDPAQPFDTIPSGKYLVQIVDSDYRQTKNGKGWYIWLEFQILEGDYAGRKLWDRINRENENQQAVDIGARTFSALCHAIGKLVVSRTEELLGTPPIVATVKYRPATEVQEATGDKPAQPARDASNDIRGYAPVKGTASPSVPGKVPPPTVARAAPSVSPWQEAKMRRGV